MALLIMGSYSLRPTSSNESGVDQLGPMMLVIYVMSRRVDSSNGCVLYITDICYRGFLPVLRLPWERPVLPSPVRASVKY